MSALPRESEPRRAPMTLAMLDAVLAVERQAYPFPWTRGNFVDSLVARYGAEVLIDGDAVVGYFVAMAGVQETHLLNVTVAPAYQHRGHGRVLLDALVAQCRARGDHTLWLEVRESNDRARAIYARYGFVEVGRRRAYYPAPHGAREDALVLSLELSDVD
jgi:ribosomal-protein-alanine N-acetyltransferase